MAERGHPTTFNNHGPVQQQAGRDINSTYILANPAFLDDLSLQSLHQYAHSKDQPDIQQLAADRLKKRLAALTDADDWITRSCYTEEDLKIERLSGERLPLDQCYINLVGVAQGDRQSNRSNHLSRLSLSRRLHIQGPEQGTEIQLRDIFRTAQGRAQGSQSSKRVLIRGQAGAGKSTFCKKAIHDFVHNKIWRDQFDRMLWIRLRNLRSRTGRYNLDELLHDEFFSQHPESRALTVALRDVCANPSDGRSLFLLDGLDEIWHDLKNQSDLARFVTHLLNQPNVLVLSRPSVGLRSDIRPFNLELEMVGFSPDQVYQYVQRMEPTKYEAIRDFLESHPIVQDLVRIPIQLDALCYGWDQIRDQGPETMTELYCAIEKGLWRKDIVRLGKQVNGRAITEEDTIYDAEVEPLIEAECRLVELLAFTGVRNNVIEFHERHLNAICQHFGRHDFSVGATLPKLSYLRTSDSSAKNSSKTHHFLHLTLQEYFAARYFARAWCQQGELVCLNFDQTGALQRNPASPSGMKPREYLARHKYSLSHDIMWRFVAGLLCSGPAGCDESELLQFFQAIDEEPLDVLGLAHQRLIMRCIIELNTSNASETLKTYKTRLEDHLGAWAIYQAKRRGGHSIAQELEFPNRVLFDMLRQEDCVIFEAAVSACTKWSRSRLPAEFVSALTSCLGHASSCKLAGLALLHPSKLPIFRGTAIQALRPSGHWSEDVADAIIGCLASDDVYLKHIVLYSLKGSPQIAAAHIHAISTCLNTSNDRLKELAISVLREQQRLPRKTLEYIVGRLCSPMENGNLRATMLEILRDNSYWADFLLARGETVVDSQAPENESQRLVATGLALLKHPDLNTARVAVLALGFSDNKLSRTAINQIIECLSHEDESMRLESLTALARQSHLLLEHLRAISACLKDPSQGIQLAAINVFEGRSALADMDDTLCSLVWCLGSPNHLIRLASAKILQRQKSLSEKVFRAMISLFERQSSYFVNRSSVMCTRVNEVMVPFDEHFLLGITSHLQDTNWLVRRGALSVFHCQPKLPESVLQAVVECLSDEQYDIRLQAGQVLEGHQSDLNERMYASMKAQLSQSNDEIRESVFRAFWGVLDASGYLLDLVKEALQDPNYSIKFPAFEFVLQRLSSFPEFQDAAVMFLNTLVDQDWMERRDAFQIIDRHWAGFRLNESAILALTRFLADEDEEIRGQALRHIIAQPNLSRRVISEMSPFLSNLADASDAVVDFFRHEGAYEACLANVDVAVLFKCFLYSSEAGHVAWLMQDGQAFLETESFVVSATLKGAKELTSVARKARRKFGMPDVVMRPPRTWFGLEW